MIDNIVDLDPHRALAVKCKKHLAVFVRTFWSMIISDELVEEWHMEALCEELEAVFRPVFLRTDPHDPDLKVRLAKTHDLIVNIPPGTSKSTICTIMAPAWAWANDPTLRIMTGSHSDSLSTEHAQKSRDIITSGLYRKLFPNVRIKDDKGLKTNYATTLNGQRFATSVGSKGTTGMHAHIIIIDDPLNPKTAVSAAGILAANQWMDKTLSTRKTDKKITVRILIMQRLAVHDCTGHALQKGKATERLVCLPGEIAANVTPEYAHKYVDGLLSPKRLGRAELAELRIDLGAAGYAGQIQQRPAPEGGLLWNDAWFKIVPDRNFPKWEDLHEQGTDWDLAYTKEEINAASAYIRSGVLGGLIYIYAFDWKWHEFPELIKWMKEVGGPHYIENKGPGKSAKQGLQKKGVVAIEVKVKKDKIARAKDATPPAEAGMVYLRESMADRFFNDPKQGIVFFPNGEFMDLADTLSQMITRRSAGGSITLGNATRAVPEGERAPVMEEDPLDWL